MMNVIIDDRGAILRFKNSSQQGKKAISDILHYSAIEGERDVRQEAPTFDGDLRRSIRSNVDEIRQTARIDSELRYADAVHLGSRPHFPPYKAGTPLHKWAVAHGMSPYLLARHISKVGTKANPFFKRAYDTLEPKAERFAESRINKFTEEMNRG